MERKVIIIDNYDSFTYNLVHLVHEITEQEVEVVRNDEVDIENLKPYSHIILSPGPGLPDEAGDLKRIIQEREGSSHILGVCLGLQAIGEVYGAELMNLDEVYHGKSTEVHRCSKDSILLDSIDDTFLAGRYHSWVLDARTMNNDLIVTAQDDDGQIMAIRHAHFPTYGVQFHPESIMTPDGHVILKNFLDLKPIVSTH